MHDSSILKVSDEVRTAFEPIMKVLGRVRQNVLAVKDVVTVRPGYGYPRTGAPVPAVVLAVTPGTAPVRASELQEKFGVPFNVTEATVEEQELARSRLPVSFSLPEGPTVSAFERLIGGEEAIAFGPPRLGATRSWIRRICRS